MLLRSSSTPILGSILPSSSPFFPESATNNGSQRHHHYHHSLERSSSSSSSSSFPHDIAHHPKPSLSCRFSPLSGSSDRDSSSFGFRRAQSDGNLKYLLPDDSHHHHHLPVKSSSSGRRANPVLETIPSFSMDDSIEEEEEPQEDEAEEGGGGLTRSVTIGDIITAEFGFSYGNKNAVLDENSREMGKVGTNAVPPLYLARGLGIDRLGSGIMNAGSGCGGGSKFAVLTGNGGEQFDMETYYKMMVDEKPGSALFL